MAEPTAPPTALERALGFLTCPVCGHAFVESDGALRCTSGHSFDVARQGYVSFLTGGAGSSTADTAHMVAARDRFLGGGYYDRIADAVAAAVGADAEGLALEIGGGTGFYLARLLDARPGLLGIDLDLSARALRIAARAHERLAAIAADAWRPLPFADDAAAVILSVFSPRNAPEMARILRPGGRLVIVSPTRRHLAELVGMLGLVTVDERKPERLDRAFESFDLLSTRSLEYAATLGTDAVRDVVMMGPSARHIEPARLEALADATPVTVSVEVRTYTPG